MLVAYGVTMLVGVAIWLLGQAFHDLGYRWGRLAQQVAVSAEIVATIRIVIWFITGG